MDLPKGVFERYGSYHLDLGRVDGKRKSKKLCRITDGEAALYEALAKAKRPAGETMGDLFDEFLAHGLSELSENTKTDYRGYIRRTLRPKFGHMLPHEVEGTHVAQLLERRKKAGAPVSANREVACLSSVFQFGMRNGFCKTDPTRGIRRNREKPRDRYPRHQEFREHFKAAPEWFQDIVGGIYLMELRPNEARKLKRSVVHDEGIIIEQSKTGKVKIIKWNSDLKFFINRALTRSPNSEYVFTNSRGGPVTKWAMASVWRRLRKKLGLSATESFRVHDIRAKGESDHKSGGHKLLTLYKRAELYEPVNWVGENEPDSMAGLGDDSGDSGRQSGGEGSRAASDGATARAEGSGHRA